MRTAHYLLSISNNFIRHRGRTGAEISYQLLCVRKLINKMHDLPWILPLLRAKFYVPCGGHSKRERIYFCFDCMGNTFCNSCLGLHEDHHIFRVYKASGYAGIPIEDLDGMLDISNIQKYFINGRRVVYIYSRNQNEKEHCRGGRCEVCGWMIQEDCGFCSIACKLGIRGGNNARLRVSGSEELKPNKKVKRRPHERKVSPSSTPPPAIQPQSLKRHRRKGIPKRSPFF